MASKITILVSDFENSKTPQQMGRRNLYYQNANITKSDHDTSLLILATTVSVEKNARGRLPLFLKKL